MSQDLVEHLRFFQALGVRGVSRDAAWRRRQVLAPDVPDVPMVPDVPEAGQAAAASNVIPLAQVSDSSPAGLLATLKVEIGPQCKRCKLHALGRKQVVFGVGDPHAQLMFVGEAPGGDEDIQGEPFVGKAGQLLTKIIEAIELRRDQVYIANVIKCRPPGNRNPEPDEVEQCEPFLFRQIDAIKPKVIVALGKFAAQSLLRTTEPITRLRGRQYNYRAPFSSRRSIRRTCFAIPARSATSGMT
jgi:uracil-DNA glycosylase family 4